MLALIDKSNHTFIQQVPENGGWLRLPDGSMISVYADGWSNESYCLSAIASADSVNVPSDKILGDIIVEVHDDNSAKYVQTLLDKPRPTSDEVNSERDRRIATGFVFSDKSYAMDSESKARIIGAATLAGFAVGAGAQAGNYRWANANTDFVWIADDNSLTQMDAPTCFAFGQAAAAWESSCIFAARAIKETNPVPFDYITDSYWP